MILLELGRVARRVTNRFPDAGGLIRSYAPPAHFLDQQPAHEQRIVTDHFRVEPEARPPREQPVLRILLNQSRRHRRTLLVRCAGDHESNHVLHVPAALDELRREPVQQFRVRGPFTLRADVAGSFHETGAKELLPEAIHGHARRERMFGADEPPCEIEAIGGRTAGGQRRQHMRHAGRHRVAALIVLAAFENESAPGLFHFLGNHGGDERVVQIAPLLPDFAQGFLQGFERGARRGVNVGDVVFAQNFLLRCGTFIRVGLECVGNFLGPILFFFGFFLLFPSQQGDARPILLGRRGDDASPVPVNRPAELGERDSVNLRPGFQLQLARVNFQSHPFADLRQPAQEQLLRRAFGAESNRVLVAPVGAVQPFARVVLKHDRFGRVRRIEINVGEQRVTRADQQRGRRLGEKVLGQPCVRPRDRLFATVNFPGFDPLQRPGRAAGFRLGPLREFVFHPDEIGGLIGGRARGALGFGVFDFGGLRANLFFHGGDGFIELPEFCLLFRRG